MESINFIEQIIHEGYICAKLIKTNVEDNKKDYTFKRLNIYKNYIFNKDYKYETLFKEYSLIDFVINKFKNKKYKNYRFNLL
jgi:hypothetical protein